MAEKPSGQELPLGKGKGKATAPTTADEQVDGPPTEDIGKYTSGLAKQLAESARHLSRSLGGIPDNGDLSLISSAGGSKIGAAAVRNPSAAGESSSTVTQQPGVAAVAGGGNAFRSTAPGDAEAHKARAEAAFSAFLDSTSVAAPGGRTELESAWEKTAPRSENPGGQSVPRAQVGSFAEQEALDGLEVVDLLGQPVTDAGMDPDEEPASERDIAALRSALFGQDPQGTVRPPAWDNLLNFIPDFVRPDPVQSLGSSNPANLMEAQAILGVSHGPEAEKLWLAQWTDVLTRYNDEVWGDLSSLAQEAREEIQQLENLQPGEAPPEPKAVRRLQQVLGHIRGF